LQQLAIVLGIFLALLADWAIASAAGGSEREWLLGLEAWRWMFLSMTVASVLYGVLALTIPESPRHLVAKGHLEEAREVLRRVLGNIDLDAKSSRSGTRLCTRPDRACGTCAALRWGCCRSCGSASCCRCFSSSSAST
jgi:MFS family permease